MARKRTARWLAVALACLATPAAAHTAAPIQGRVLSAENGAALPRVRLSLNITDPRAEPVLSDDEGRFVLPFPASITADSMR